MKKKGRIRKDRSVLLYRCSIHRCRIHRYGIHRYSFLQSFLKSVLGASSLSFSLARIGAALIAVLAIATICGCSLQSVLQSSDIIQGSKGVSGVTPTSSEVSLSSSKVWHPDHRYFSPNRAHSAQVLDIFPLISLPGKAANVLSVDRAGRVLLWPLEQNMPYEVYSVGGEIDRATLSADQKLLAVVQGSRVSVHHLPLQKEVRSLARLRTRTASIGFHPDSRSLVIGGVDGKVYRWKFADDDVGLTPADRNKNFERYFGHSTVVSAVAYHPFGRVFFSADWRGMLRAWRAYDADLYEGAFDRNIFAGDFFSERTLSRVAGRADGNRVESIRVEETGERFVLGTSTGVIELWDVRGFKNLVAQSAHRGLVRDLDLFGDSGKVLTYGRDSTLKLWQIVATEDEVLGEKFYSFELVGQSRLPSLRRVRFYDENLAVAGTTDGTMLVVHLNKLDPPEEEVAKQKKKESMSVDPTASGLP